MWTSFSQFYRPLYIVNNTGQYTYIRIQDFFNFEGESSWLKSVTWLFIFSKKVCLMLLLIRQWKKKCSSSSRTLQILHILWSRGIFLYLPTSTSRLWSLIRNFVISWRLLKFFNCFRYSSNLNVVFNPL